MQYAFFGTPRFARLVLENISAYLGVPVAIVCNPDKPRGRGNAIAPPPVKELAAERGWNVPVLQPRGKSELKQVLRGVRADCFIVAAYGKILPEEVLSLPPRGTVGVHPSLLPAYRGPSPMRSALLTGERRTGVTLFLLDREMDHGPVLAERELARDLDDLYYEELESLLAELGGALVCETVPAYVKGAVTPEAQDESRATYTKFFSTDDAFVSPETLKRALEGDETAARTLLRMLHAFTPAPGVWTMGAKGERVKLLRGALRDGKFALEKIQYAGKNPRDFTGTL